MRRAILPLVLALLLMLPTGCAKQQTPNFSGTEPVSVRQSKPLELGDVTMALWTPSQDEDAGRCATILRSVCDHIGQQRNIHMNLKLKYVQDVDAYVRDCAAGVMPEITISIWAADKEMPSMLRLNEALEKYGPYLKSKIPEEFWVQNKIGDSIVAIPVLCATYMSVPIVNRTMLDRYDWQMPATLTEFEALLQKAKEAGLRPINSEYPYYAPELFGIDDWASAWKDDKGKLHAPTDAPEYEDFLNTMRRWKQAGYFQGPIVDKTGATVRDGLWLFDISVNNGSGWDNDLQTDTTLEPLPLIALGKSPPVSRVRYYSNYHYMSYQRPEALVTLMDWMYESVENHTLIARGIEDTDYVELGSNGYSLLGRTEYEHQKWSLQWLLRMDGFDGRPIKDCTNAEGVRKAMEYQMAAERPSNFVSDPRVTAMTHFALPSTSLYKTLYPEPAEGGNNAADTTDYNPAIDYEYANGKISWDKEKEHLAKFAEQCKPLIDLMQRVQDGSYDPVPDMIKPASAPSN